MHMRQENHLLISDHYNLEISKKKYVSFFFQYLIYQPMIFDFFGSIISIKVDSSSDFLKIFVIARFIVSDL